MGVKSCSAEYFWYWQTIRSGIMFRTTFGTWTTSLVDNVIVLAPNGRSWITWELVIKFRKCANFASGMNEFVCALVGTSFPLPWTASCCLATLNLITCQAWDSLLNCCQANLISHYGQYLPARIPSVCIFVAVCQRVHQFFIQTTRTSVISSFILFWGHNRFPEKI